MKFENRRAPHYRISVKFMMQSRGTTNEYYYCDGHRELNKTEGKDTYVLPCIDDALDCLVGSTRILVLKP